MASPQPPAVPPPPEGEGGHGAPTSEPPGEGSGGASAGRGRKPFLLRLSPEVMDELRTWAGHEMRSLNAHIEYLLRDAVRRRNAAAAGKKDKS